MFLVDKMKCTRILKLQKKMMEEEQMLAIISSRNGKLCLARLLPHDIRVAKISLSAVSVKYSVYLSPRAAPPVKGVFTDTVEWGQFECGVGVLWRL